MNTAVTGLRVGVRGYERTAEKSGAVLGAWNQRRGLDNLRGSMDSNRCHHNHPCQEATSQSSKQLCQMLSLTCDGDAKRHAKSKGHKTPAHPIALRGCSGGGVAAASTPRRARPFQSRIETLDEGPCPPHHPSHLGLGQQFICKDTLSDIDL